MAEKPGFLQSIAYSLWNPRYNLEDPNTPVNGKTVAEIFGATKSKSGQNVNHDIALKFSAVWSCVRVLTGAINPLPLQVFKKTANGRESVSDTPISRIVSKQPNPLMTKSVFIDRAVNHYSLWGNHYAHIIRDGNANVIRLDLIHPEKVEVKLSRVDGREVLVYKIEGYKDPIRSENMIHVPGLGDGYVGKSIIQYAREDIGLEFAAQQYGAEFFESGGKPSGLISNDVAISNEQTDQILDLYEKQLKKGKNLLLPNGFKYTPISIPPEDMQFILTRDFNATTIARWFGVPPDKIADLKRATFSNIEHQSISFLQDTITPIVSKFENEYTNKIFGFDKEFYIEFNIDAYLRADTETKSKLYQSAIQNGWMSINEVRQKQNLNSVEGGDRHYIQQNMMPVDIAEEILKGKHKSNGVGEKI